MTRPGIEPCRRGGKPATNHLSYGTAILTNYVTPWSCESFLGSRQSLSYSRISQHFMEPKGSLPCSQEPSNGPYLSQINPVCTTSSSFFKIYLNISFLLAFPQKPYIHSYSPPRMLHALPISSSLAWSFQLYLAKSTSYCYKTKLASLCFGFLTITPILYLMLNKMWRWSRTANLSKNNDTTWRA
jgi:hypothetical protein